MVGSWRETELDRETELKVSDWASVNWRCQLQKTEIGCPYDFKALREGKLGALVEVRKRNVTAATYEDLFMGKAKWSKLILLGHAYEVPVLFVAVFDDCAKWVDLTKLPRLKTTYASRGKDPSGGPRATDNEESVLVPVAEMKTAW